jgi:hypothetical protein
VNLGDCYTSSKDEEAPPDPLAKVAVWSIYVKTRGKIVAAPEKE